jgi:lysophospholipase L1-like esterase
VSYCDQLRALAPTIEWVNVGWAGTGVLAATPPNAMDQLAAAQRQHADAVILAFGTNDLAFSPDQIVAAYRAVCAAARPAACYVATTPPRYRLAALVTNGSAPTDAVNAALRAAFDPAVLIDFDTGFAIDLYQADGLHLTTDGQALRAQRVLARVH